MMTETTPLSAPVRVLLVEDSDVDAHLFETVLRRFTFTIERVTRLSEAIEALRSSIFDVVLCDLGLPDSSGLATLDALFEHAGATPIVVVTARNDEDTALQAVASGAQDYLVKGSMDPNALVRAVRYAVERWRANEDVGRSEARMRTLLEGALDAVVSIRDDGRVVRWNRSAEEMFGWPHAEALGVPIEELIVPERFRARFRQGLETCLASGEGPLGRRVEWIAVRRDGTELPVEVRITAERDADGTTFTAFIANVGDVTARRQAQQAHDQLRRQYELILHSIHDGVHGVDLAGNVIFENAAAAAMLGWGPSELIGRPAHSTFHYARGDGTPRPQSECPMHLTLTDGTVRNSTDEVFWRKDGTPIRVELTSAPMRDEHGRIAGAVVTFRDLSRQRQLEQQIEQASRVASLGRVSASVAHEFNNVLMGMSPFVELLRIRSRADESLAKPVQYLLSALRRGHRLTQEILGFTCPPEPRLETIDVASWLCAVCDEARGLLGARTLDAELPDALWIRSDADQLSQVMLNFVTNARDATPPDGTVTIGAARADEIPFLRGRVADSDRMAALFVRDDGSGIRPEIYERIFEPMFTTKQGGHGLGLAAAFQIVTRLGGQIVIETDPGAGSTFHVVLPMG